MMRKILSITFMAVLAFGAQAQTIDSLFTAIPDAVMPLLDHNSRLDMLDLYNCKMKASVGNDLNGESCLLQKDSTHVLVRTSSASTFEMRLLPLEKDTIYACLRTVAMPKEYSQLQFLHTDWSKTKVKQPENVTFERCWQPTDSLSIDRIEELRLLLQPVFFVMHWETASAGEPCLVCQVSTKGLMKDDEKDAVRCLRPLKYIWREGKLVEDGK